MVARSVGCITTALAFSLLAQQAPPTIRARTTLVPIDVRVVDLNGNPVTDLRKEDFTVEEDGVRQDVRLFEAHALTAETPAPGGPARHHELAADATTGVQTQRIFLFVLGRGRLQAPGKAIDAAIDFVRGRLLPQDRVAVLAYNRATDFTTDRAAIVTTLERFRKGHERVEADMAQYFSGLRAVYGSRELPGHIQRQVDEIFSGPGVASARRLPPGTPTDARQQADDVRRGAEALQRAEVLANRLPGSGVDTTFDLANADLVGGSFDEFANATVEAGQGLSSIYTAITYLRHLNGEKHIIFMNERGLFLPRAENDGSVAALASDARVVIDTIQTGGVLSMNPLGRPCPVCPTQVMPDRLARMSNNQVFAEQAVRNIAALTGGLASITGRPRSSSRASIARPVFSICSATLPSARPTTGDSGGSG
jgi:VWFA-related protein